MPTARQIAAARKRTRLEAERARHARDRAALKQLRGHLRHARQLRRTRLREIVQSCQDARALNRARAKVIRAEHRAAAAAEIERVRTQSRNVCEGTKSKARAQGADRLARVAVAIEAERKHQTHLARYARKRPLAKAGKRRAADAIAESDSEVEHNIPADMVGVFRKVKRKIKGSPRRSRTEAFLEWAAEHRNTVLRLVDAQVEDDVAELVKQEAELRRNVAQPRRYRRMSSAELAEVPF